MTAARRDPDAVDKTFCAEQRFDFRRRTKSLRCKRSSERAEMQKTQGTTISPSVRTLIGILNFRLSPSTIVGVAPVQALTSIERATIGAIHHFSKAELKQIALH
jgi:hypothetical protein